MSYGSVETGTLPRARCPRRRRLPAILLAAVATALPPMGHASGNASAELVAALQARPSSMHGEALFNDTCIACHGPDGGGQADGSVPAIAAQLSGVIIRQVVDFRHGRRQDLRMEHSTGPRRLVDAQDIADVADYVSSLPPTRASDTGNGELLAAGQLAYGRWCAACHGITGSGEVAGDVPRLAGQHYRYLLGQMLEVIAGGRPAFPPEHALLLQHLERSDLTGIADYLSRLGAPALGTSSDGSGGPAH